MKLPGWTGEPLVHFLLGGALLFAFFAWRGEPVDPASRTIELTRADQARLALNFERVMQRPPTDAELDAVIDQYLREEVLYREALRLGLDQNDIVVRRRLTQKMDELAAAQAETAAPTREELQAWLKAHPERFVTEARYSLEQRWYPDRDTAKAALARLHGGAAPAGEAIDLPPRVEAMERVRLVETFGSTFVEEVDRIKPGSGWHGPVASGFGFHLVRLGKRELGAVPPLATIRDQVEDDWRLSTMRERKQEAYRLLRQAYRIKVDK